MREKKIFLYMAAPAYHVISEEVKNHILRHTEFLDTHLYKQPTLTNGGITIFLCKYFI